jgi:toxin-antitoxin system PIN domain toxin
VKLVDTNVLLYAIDEESPDHAISRQWLTDALSGDEAVGFAWLTLVGFLRISTSTKYFTAALTIRDAAGLIRLWLGQPPAVVVTPGLRHLPTMTELLESAGAGGNLVNDAHLAALALEHGADVVSFDRDFARFEGVRWIMPGAY